MIYIRNADGHVDLARLGERTLVAHWHKHWKDREVVTEWSLTLEGKPIAIVDRAGAPAVIALHRWDEGHPHAVAAVRSAEGKWSIEVPMAWHTTCVAVSGALQLVLDEEMLQATVSEELQVEL